MSNNEAKFILQAYRPGGADASDPAMAEALAQAKADPALAEWFKREQAHAAAVAAKLREIAPPAGLRDAILAGARAAEQSPQTKKSRRHVWTWVGLAAAIALLASVGAMQWRKTARGDRAFTAMAFDDVVHGRHGGHGVAEEQLQARLGQTSTHLSAGLPVEFQALAGTGCRTLRFAGHDVLEVCFVRDGAEYHCYIAPAAAFSGSGEEAAPRFVQQGALAAATWTAGGYRYVVVGQASLERIRGLL